MPILNGSKDINKFLFDFSVLCGKHFICEHIALENENIRKQLAIKEDFNIKLKKVENILLEEF